MRSPSRNASTVTGSPTVGVAWMVFGTAMIVSMDTIAKLLAENYPVVQIVWARYVTHLAIMLILCRGEVRALFATRRLPLQIGRSALMILATLGFFTVISLIPLATASAIMFSTPIFVTALAAPLLGESVGWRRWAGVAVGCAGALLITRPGTAAWDPAMGLALAVAVFYALYQIATRALSHTDPPTTTLAYTALVGAGAMTLIVPFFWRTPGSADALLMMLVGALGAIAHYAVIKAFTAAPASVVTPIGYTSLLWATLYGIVVFGELPDLSTYVGAGVICASALYVLHRERQSVAS